MSLPNFMKKKTILFILFLFLSLSFLLEILLMNTKFRKIVYSESFYNFTTKNNPEHFINISKELCSPEGNIKRNFNFNSIVPLSCRINYNYEMIGLNSFLTKKKSDKFGFFNEDHYYKKNKKILIFGDSNVSGFFTKEDDISEKLNKEQNEYAFLNLGMPDQSILGQFATLKEYLNKINEPKKSVKHIIFINLDNSLNFFEKPFSVYENEIIQKYIKKKNFKQNLDKDEIHLFYNEYEKKYRKKKKNIFESSLWPIKIESLIFSDLKSYQLYKKPKYTREDYDIDILLQRINSSFLIFNEIKKLIPKNIKIFYIHIPSRNISKAENSIYENEFLKKLKVEYINLYKHNFNNSVFYYEHDNHVNLKAVDEIKDIIIKYLKN